MVILGEQIFAMPLVNVNEIFHLDLSKTNIVDGQKTIIVRNKAIPLFYLRQWLASSYIPPEEPEIEHVVVVNVGTQRVGFVVDQLIGQEEVVIKPLGAFLQGTKGLSGATITGDGQIALILDFPELMKAYANRGY
jgi:two-component system chemotaxis sensor kinase CheA